MENVSLGSPLQRPAKRRMGGPSSVVRWIGVVLLFVVGYIHLALMVNMFGLSQMIGKLFLLNAIGALAAIVLVLVSPKWYGWVLGILVSGGAAFAKLGMRSMPWLGSFIMGGRGFGSRGARRTPSGGFGASGKPGNLPTGNTTGIVPKGHSGSFPGGHAGNFGPGGGHSILPVFGNMGSVGTVSVYIEIAFVIFAVLVLVLTGLKRAK